MAQPDHVDAQQAETITPATSAARGTPLGARYELEREIGRGATGRVWLGRRLADGASLAFKVMHPQYGEDTEAVVRFLSQRTILDKLRHPHLVTVHDLIADDVIAIVMDVADGESLRTVLAKGQLSGRQLLIVLSQIASALAAMHAVEVVHRDIKPENIMVGWHDGRPHALLTDLGLARSLQSPRLTATGGLSGTPGYIAPEVLADRPAQPASDVYALGVVAYEALAGRPPFQMATAEALMRAHLDEVPQRPPGWSDLLWKAVSLSLAKDPHQRPSANALSFWLRGLATQPDALTSPPDIAAQLPGGPQNAPGRAHNDAHAAWPHHAPTSARTDAPHHGPVAADAGAPHHAAVAAYAPHDGLGAGWDGRVEAQHQPTLTASRPVPEAPVVVPRKSRRLAWIAAVVACAVVGVGAGVWWNSYQSKPPATQPSAGPAAHAYFLPLAASSPEAGVIELVFADATSLPGFTSYLIYRDDLGVLASIPAGNGVPPYRYTAPNQETAYCYQVAALLYTDHPPQPLQITPGCHAANGKP